MINSLNFLLLTIPHCLHLFCTVSADSSPSTSVAVVVCHRLLYAISPPAFVVGPFFYYWPTLDHCPPDFCCWHRTHCWDRCVLFCQPVKFHGYPTPHVRPKPLLSETRASPGSAIKSTNSPVPMLSGTTLLTWQHWLDVDLTAWRVYASVHKNLS